MDNIQHEVTWEQEVQTLQLFVEIYNSLPDDKIKDCIIKLSESLTIKCCMMTIENKDEKQILGWNDKWNVVFHHFIDRNGEKLEKTYYNTS